MNAIPRLHVGMSPLLAAVLVACADQPHEAEWSVSTDSIDGVVHVVNTPPAAGARPTLVAEEEWRIGTVDAGGPTSFGYIREIAVLADGRFAVADGHAEEVRLFDANGGHLRTFGGPGGGPGELAGMQGVHVDHEGMLRVAEQKNARLSVFHPDSGLRALYPLQLHSYAASGPWPAAIDTDGRTFVKSAGRFGEARLWYMVRVYDPTMTQLDSIPYEEYTETVRIAIGGGRDDQLPGVWRVSFAGGMMWAPVPFYSRPYEVIAPGGEIWSSAQGKAELVISRWRPAGDTSLVIRSLRPPQPVTAAERDSAMRELTERLARRTSPPPRLDPSRVPTIKPPLHGLFLADGRLWVRLTEPTADSTVYDVFRGDGAHVETVLFPYQIDEHVPPVVRGDEAWAVVTDEFDVQYVSKTLLRSVSDGSRE